MKSAAYFFGFCVFGCGGVPSIRRNTSSGLMGRSGCSGFTGRVVAGMMSNYPPEAATAAIPIGRDRCPSSRSLEALRVGQKGRSCAMAAGQQGRCAQDDDGRSLRPSASWIGGRDLHESRAQGLAPHAEFWSVGHRFRRVGTGLSIDGGGFQFADSYGKRGDVVWLTRPHRRNRNPEVPFGHH